MNQNLDIIFSLSPMCSLTTSCKSNIFQSFTQIGQSISAILETLNHCFSSSIQNVIVSWLAKVSEIKLGELKKCGIFETALITTQVFAL